MSTPEYKKANYDSVYLMLQKGKRDEYKQAAEDFGISLRELVQTSVESFIAEKSYRDFESLKPAPPAEKLSTEQKQLLAEFDKLPPDVQKSIVKMIRAINAEFDRR